MGGSRVIRTPWFQTAPARMLRWAACVVLLAALAAWWLQPRREPARFAEFRQQMIQTLERAEGPLDLASPDLQEIRRWLAARQAPDHLPAGSRLGESAPLGCRLLRWQGRPVALICFRLDGGRRAHLLVAATDAFADPPPAEPTLARQDSWTTAAWSRGDWAYLLAGRDVSPEELQRLL
ncbi:MAG: hypothetical protein D6766_09725 [Verrucomicrobia bacterium]|nr:MAG: hypothetical protein D6766_09725 [Verrucomicrobiota bacterium]